MQPNLIQQEEYINHLLKDIPREKQTEVLKEAYKNALDTRKFEIDLYWKRATYFWAFIAAIFLATYSMLNSNFLLNEKDPSITILKKALIILIVLLGYLFSLGWYFVNRGSKVWQKNWETHIDLLENTLNGPLFKTLIKPNLNFWSLNSYYPFSVSKVNQFLSLCVTVFWALLMNLLIVFLFKLQEEFCCWMLSILTTSFALFLFSFIYYKQTVSFMHKHWKKGSAYKKTTYIDIN